MHNAVHNGITMERSHMRAQMRGRKDSAARFELVNQYGTVRVYTRRHIHGCPLATPDHNHCSCPKWIYAKSKSGAPTQKAAGTPSFAEACEQAQKILRGFDPELQQRARMIEAAAPASSITVEEALAKYYAVLRSRRLAPDYLGGSITPVFDRRRPRPHGRGRRAVNVPLLTYLDAINLDAIKPGAADPTPRLEQITGALLDDWMTTWETNDITSKIWRTVATSFFRWAAGRDYRLHPSLANRLAAKVALFGDKIRVRPGNRCGYFTDEQMQKIYAALPFYRARRGFFPAHYAERLHAMVDLGRWAGMAMVDIVAFAPRLNLGANQVLTYRRHKTGQMAAVLLDAAVAARLGSIPAEEGSLAEQPLRFAGRSADRSAGIWRQRFQKLCQLAGIQEIETELGVSRQPHPHMLRDTFAIDAISRGVALDNVAKMLGHATIEMTQKSYLFWITKRIDHCIEDQRKALTRVQPAVASSSEQDGVVRGTLVH